MPKGQGVKILSGANSKSYENKQPKRFSFTLQVMNSLKQVMTGIGVGKLFVPSPVSA